MVFTLAGILGPAVFAMQLVLCFRSSRRWIRGLMPVVMLTGLLICIGVMTAEHFIRIPLGASFGAYIYGMILLFLLAMDGLAWLIYGIVKLVQKRRK